MPGRGGWVVWTSVLLGACDNEDTAVVGRTDTQLAEALLDRIADREGWGQPDGWEGRPWVTPGSPHERYVEIRANDVAARALGDERLPPGAILTKDHHGTADGTEPADIVNATWRLRGLDTEDGGLFWARWEQGELVVAGANHEMCVACHSSGPGWVRSVIDAPGQAPAED